MATQRSTTSTRQATMNGAAKTPPSPPQTSKRSPFIPSIPEGLILAIYPLILVLGSLYGYLSISPTLSPYNPTTQSHDPATAPSYFARKNNIFNLYFVKVGWFWTTLGFWALHLLTAPQSRTTVSSQSAGTSITTPEPPARLVRAFARWSLATLFWAFTTQWFFGPAIIDRGFKLSGGVCDLSHLSLPNDQPLKIHESPAGPKGLRNVQDIASGVVCKAAGGVWKGGHDISGHVFLLILGSAMLLLEALPLLMKKEGELRAEVKEGRTEEGRQVGLGTKIAVGIAGLKGWMLLMTAAYFHTWFEKFTGSLVAATALWVVYFLPRGSAGVRSILGAPGSSS
ncbi:inositol phospholipid synthesis and fat-storage-inducing TM-domain-containing protein [Elsinoe ampelina]|uniref:Acyl-coenzyme A diphosphatase SCS3 n=1 Tax=Elsinoe ampelina TaxID=302913 RepID=A0A6A6GM85_9PEZI|nr:inositol phospholipid synthesis and fat-storage-inducing TM-domain-containing protein [Elsinoe ampelina]